MQQPCALTSDTAVGRLSAFGSAPWLYREPCYVPVCGFDAIIHLITLPQVIVASPLA
jgi:hypothetical protein